MPHRTRFRGKALVPGPAEPLDSGRPMDIHRVYGLFLPIFRRRRARLFRRHFDTDAATSILDVGGLHASWRHLDVPGRITCLNVRIPADAAQAGPRFTYVEGDGRDLRFPDASFDVGYSNSVIEHVGDFEDQRRFAKELQRVCRRVFVQTPNRGFFIEPHLVAPFVHLLPRRWQPWLARWCTPWGWLTRPSPERAARFVDSIRLLTGAEMQDLFPGCRIHRERFLGFTKSWVAISE
jgi:Methyltransferase domain